MSGKAVPFRCFNSYISERLCLELRRSLLNIKSIAAERHSHSAHQVAQPPFVCLAPISMKQRPLTVFSLELVVLLLLLAFTAFSQTNQADPEYIWLEAENMRGFSTGAMHEPLLNPSWLNLPRAKAPGWGISGPGVSAEWSQGGESEWNSAAASADETRAEIY